MRQWRQMRQMRHFIMPYRINDLGWQKQSPTSKNRKSVAFCHTDGGFGVRQLAAALSSAGCCGRFDGRNAGRGAAEQQRKPSGAESGSKLPHSKNEKSVAFCHTGGPESAATPSLLSGQASPLFVGDCRLKAKMAPLRAFPSSIGKRFPNM